MAFPVDAAHPTSVFSTAATSFAINVGSPSAGDLLVVLLMGRSTGPWTFSGFTQLSQSTSNGVGTLFYRLATGSEGATQTATCSGSSKACAICWRITGAADPAVTAPQFAIFNETTAAANCADPPSLTPSGGALDYLWLTPGMFANGATLPTAAPSGFTNLVTATTTGGSGSTNCGAFGSSRQLNGSVNDPGVYTHVAPPLVGTVWTVAVAPPAAGAKSLIVAGARSSRRGALPQRILR